MGREKGHNAREHTSTHGSWADTLKTMTSFNIRPTYGNSNNTQAPHHHIHTSSSTGPHSNEQNAQSKTTLSNHITRCRHSTLQATTPQRIRIHIPPISVTQVHHKILDYISRPKIPSIQRINDQKNDRLRQRTHKNTISLYPNIINIILSKAIILENRNKVYTKRWRRW
jgi:hypothetical protein